MAAVGRKPTSARADHRSLRSPSRIAPGGWPSFDAGDRDRDRARAHQFLDHSTTCSAAPACRAGASLSWWSKSCTGIRAEFRGSLAGGPAGGGRGRGTPRSGLPETPAPIQERPECVRRAELAADLVERDPSRATCTSPAGSPNSRSCRPTLSVATGTHPPAQLISGMGGVGKTEIATEYIHRHIDKYEIIWWIRAEHHRSRPGRAGQAGTAAGTAASGARTAVATGRSRRSWTPWTSGPGRTGCWSTTTLAQPLDLQRYLPACRPGGHIIITSRLQNWPGYIEADSVEVSPFTEDEAISFLRRRVPALGRTRRLSTDEDERRQRGRRTAGRRPWPSAHRRRACRGLPDRDRPERRRLPDPVRGKRPPAAQRAAAGFPRPGLSHLGDVHRVADPGRRAPVQPVRVLLPRADRRGSVPAERSGRQRAARTARVPVLVAPVSRCGQPAAPVVAGQGGLVRGIRSRCTGWSRPSPEASFGKTVPISFRGVPGGRRYPARRIQPG